MDPVEKKNQVVLAWKMADAQRDFQMSFRSIHLLIRITTMQLIAEELLKMVDRNLFVKKQRVSLITDG